MHNYPTQIEGGNYDGAILVGVLEDEPEYYVAGYHAMCRPENVEERDGEPVTFYGFSEYKLDEDETLGDYILANERDYANYDSLSPFGELMKAVAENRDVKGGLTDKQALAYALRDIVGVDRRTTAARLDMSPNTVDNVLSTARGKVSYAMAISDAVSLD